MLKLSKSVLPIRIVLLYIRQASYIQQIILLQITLGFTSCSFPIHYSITNQKRLDMKSNETLSMHHSSTFTRYTNKTTFPSLNYWLAKTFQEADPKCKKYYLNLEMTSPQALNAELTLIQSFLILKISTDPEEKNVLYTITETVTFSSAQSVNKESYLQKATRRLLDQVMLWCASQN